MSIQKKAAHAVMYSAGIPCHKTRSSVYDIAALPDICSKQGNDYIYGNIPAMTLFVAGLPYDLDDAELMEIFEKFGPVKSAKVAMDRETGKSKGFGFVEMVEDEHGREAIEMLNDISLGKKPLVVKQAEDRPSGGGGYRPGGGRPGGGRPGGDRPYGGGGGGYNRRDNDRGPRRY
jgi:RNA recognition motif-containing protein